LAETKFLNSPSIHAPFGYSHVAEISKGKIIYVSGQISLDKSGILVGKGDILAQSRQAFENLKIALESVGAKMSDIVKLNYYMVDMSRMPEFRSIRDSFFPDKQRMPASTAIGVTRLALPDLLVEIEAVAATD
jgi:enamine deaminase RidA (YjgF/YER057c/UK114 family)